MVMFLGTDDQLVSEKITDSRRGQTTRVSVGSVSEGVLAGGSVTKPGQPETKRFIQSEE